MAQDKNWWTEGSTAVDAKTPDGEWWAQGATPAQPPKRSIGAALNDTVIEAANAAAGGVSSAANFVKPGNAASKWIDENIVKAGEAKQSDVVKAEKQRLSADMSAAEGVGDEVAAVGRYIVNNPVLAAAQAAGSFVGPGLAVKGATTAARAAGAAAKTVERAGRAGGVAAGAAMAGGDAAGTAYELASKAGATEDQSVAAGRQASVIPAIVGGVGGAFGAEKLLAGAKGFTGGTVARALKTGASEAAQEGIEEGVTQYEGQRAAMPYDAAIDPSKGVAGAAAMGAALGGITGAGMGALDSLRQRAPTPSPDPAEPLAAPGDQPPEAPTLALPAPVIDIAADGTARTAEDRNARLSRIASGDVTDVTPIPSNPVREQVAAAAEQGGALSGAALTAIDSGAYSAMQPVAPDAAQPAPISLEEADARDQAAYEQFFASADAEPVVARYFENDNDIPDFDAASNVSDEDFLRALGATDEDIQDAIATTRQPASPQGSAAVDAGAQANEPAGTGQGAGADATSQEGQVAPRLPGNFTGTPTATMGQQGATARPGPGFGLKDALAQIRTKKQQEAANAQAATPEATPTTQPVPAAGTGAVEAARPASIPATTGATSEPQADQTVEASPQPAQTGAAPAASAAPGQAGTAAPAGTSTVRALTDGTPAENTGAQAAPAAGAQAAAPAEPEFTTVKTVYGDSVTVRTADLNGNKPRLRQYTKDGKTKAVPAIHRDNLDLTGDKRKASAKEDADNPLFNVITTKDGSTFASQAAATRELNRLAMGETHEVVSASEVQDGAQGFVIQRKLTDTIDGRAETGGQQAEQINQYLTAERPDAVQGVNPRVPQENRALEIRSASEKEPWQMTALEFSQQEKGNPHWNQSYEGKDDGAYLADTAATHRRLVQEAIAAAPQKVAGDFIPAPDGGLDYGEITPEMGKAMRRQAGKIRLQHGVQNSNGTGWGLVHIEANHGKQISGLGFGSVQDFVAHVASGIQQVWQVPGNSQLLLTLKDGRKDVMYIQLEIAKEGDFYRVNSAFPVRQEDYESLKGMKKIWDGSEPTSAVTGQRPAFATAASASPESESSQGSSNARGQDASVPPTAPATQPDTPKLTPAEAKSLMAWEDLGQKDGVKTHALTFYESQADKDAKRGRMIVAKVSKGDRSATAWMVDGEDKTFGMLAHAKKLAEEVGMARAVADGFVEQGTKKPTVAATSGAPIEDFGQKIGGARKDVWSGFKDDLNKVMDDDIAGQPLAKVWPAPDYQKLIDAGMDAKSVSAVRALRDEVPAKPRASWKVKRWAEQVKTLRGLANDVMDGKITVQDMERMGANKGTSLRGMMGRIELYELVGHGKSLEGVRFAQHHYTLYRGRENVNLWVVEKDAGASAFSNWPREIAIGDTKEQALAAFREKYDSLDLQNAVRKAAFDIFSERGSNAFFVGKKIGRNYAKLEGPFKTVKEAREYRQNNLPALEAKLEKYKEIPRERSDVNQPRVGVDMRNGQDVTPQMFSEVFGFRGVEFGNWVEQKRRQKDLNDAFDALMDMAAVLGIPTKAISLNGELGLAFGARGSGGVNPAAAHYEPDMVVINLTKKEGAGSLGHEWWHALDNYFSKQRKTNRGSFMTTSTDVGLAARGKDYLYEGGVRQEMIDAFGAVVKAINQTAMKARAARLDGKRSKEYWTTGEEMAARAFESYLISKLQDQDASNDYLANVVSEKTWDAMAALGVENENSYPYPTAAEIPAIRAGFDHFFQTVETKEDDAGNVAMFSSADSTLPAKPLSLDRVNQLVQEALSGIRGAPPVEVTARPGDIGLRVPAGSVGYGVTLRSGDIYVFQSAMGSDLDVFKTVFHELFHRGVRVLVPKAQYVQTMLDLAKGDSRIQQLAIEWKNTEMGQKQKDNLREQGYTGAELTGQYEALAIEEALAAVAEEIKAEGKLGSKPKNMTIRYLANWLAKLADMAGMKKLAQGIRAMTYNEAERFVMSAIDRSGEPVQAGRTDNMSAKDGAPGTVNTMTEDEARKQGFTLKAYRGISKSNPFNDSGTTWLTTSREVAEAYAEEVMGYDDPGVLEVMVKPDGLPRHDASRLTDEQREAFGADEFGNPQALGIYDRSDDHPLGGSRGNVTVIHAPREAVAVLRNAAPAASRAPAGDQTQTDAFKRWFGDSKVVDANGKPLVVYHGTASEFNIFSRGRSGFFFTDDREAAQAYADHNEDGDGDPRVVDAYLSIKNPLTLDRAWYEENVLEENGDTNWEAVDMAVADADEAGHDGLILRGFPDFSGMEERPGMTPLRLEREYDQYIAFRPEQIKSATGNTGAFDPANADIRFRSADLRSLKAGALDQLHQTLSHPGKVSLWDKTVGTMRNLAERSPAFKPVFEAAQRFIDDVAMLANDAAEFAPRLLPRVESWRDLRKSPISAQDNKAVARPLFDGTLLWGRDVDGKPVLVRDLESKYANLSADDKAQMMLKAGRIDPGVLKMWRGLPLDQYESAVNTRFSNTLLKAGVVWTDQELKDLFQATPEQASLYREARKAIDRSIDMTSRADMLRLLGEPYAPMRDVVLEAPTLTDATTLLVESLEQDARENPDDRDRLAGLMHGLRQRQEKAAELMAQGYAPLSRFGRYTVDVVDAAGERQYFGMFETAREANQMALRMRSTFQGAKVTQGTMSQEAYKLFAGITPESLEMFGNMLGLDSEGSDAQDKAFQEYLRLTKNNHSALKRLIHRQGIAGYSEDVGRVLASFVYSNARQAAGALNAGTMERAIGNIPKEQGELKDVAMGLQNYIRDPQEEGQAIRGMLFAQYLGGSVASAFVNMTQPFQITLPWLSQYGGMKSAGAQLARAVKDMARRGHKYEADLAQALKHAEDDGVVSPQEIHQLMAQARGSGSLRAGDGTRVGDLRAKAGNQWEKTKVLWGQPFALAEQFNRRSTFIAAYRLAKEQGKASPAEFARRAVLETQFLYSKANKPRWARGAIGGTVFTFKTYSVSYLELMHRMWTQGGPEGKRAVGWAVAMLLLMGGAGGLPFMEDAEDLIDGAGQLMGHNVSTKQWRMALLRDVLGKELASFVEQGASGLPGAPVDVSGRLGMGNLIPGTGLFLDKPNRTRDMAELVGPAGDLISRGFTGARKALTGDLAGAALEVSPVAVRNVAKGADMATSGIYKDTKGYKVIDTTLDEALAKAIGFQPKSVAQVQEAAGFMQRSRSFYVKTSSEIKAQWAQALFNKDEAALEDVRERLAAWNRNNPEQPIVVKMPDVWKRVREMGKDRNQRIAETAPKALREQMRNMARENV